MRRGLGHPARPSAAGRDDALSVSELTRRIKTLLEGRVGIVSVTGEMSGCKASPSGHIYFSLKDASSLVDCVMWRSSASRVRQIPADGALVTVRGSLTVYEPRGRYQLVVTSISSTASKGDLWQQFEDLKEKLAAEGLFNSERKKTLPAAPRTVGLVTSPNGAAVRDMISILRRRAPQVEVVLSPCVVQGKDAAVDIITALRRMDTWGGADVVIIGRGGGSMEDLWAFNLEPVARAIAAMKTPTVSAVGHETDFTIADFVADARAATPSEAAERVVPDASHLRARVGSVAVALARSLSACARERRHRLASIQRRALYRSPMDVFMPRWQQVDEVHERLIDAMENRLRTAEHRHSMAEARLNALSPYGVLARGYAVVLGPDGRVTTDAASVTAGDTITAILHHGKIHAVTAEVEPDAAESL